MFFLVINHFDRCDNLSILVQYFVKQTKIVNSPFIQKKKKKKRKKKQKQKQKKKKLRGFFANNSARYYEKSNTWNIRHLVNESIVPSTQRSIVWYWRLSDSYYSWNSKIVLTYTYLMQMQHFWILTILHREKSVLKRKGENSRLPISQVKFLQSFFARPKLHFKSFFCTSLQFIFLLKKFLFTLVWCCVVWFYLFFWFRKFQTFLGWAIQYIW